MELITEAKEPRIRSKSEVATRFPASHRNKCILHIILNKQECGRIESKDGLRLGSNAYGG